MGSRGVGAKGECEVGGAGHVPSLAPSQIHIPQYPHPKFAAKSIRILQLFRLFGLGDNDCLCCQNRLLQHLSWACDKDPRYDCRVLRGGHVGRSSAAAPSGPMGWWTPVGPKL